MRPEHRLGIYINFQSILLVRYLEPIMGNLFTACFVNYHFDKIIFPSLGKGKPPKVTHEFSWKVSTLSHLDPHTSQCENEI